MFERLFSLDHRRRRLAKRMPDGPLKRYLAVPFPAPQTECGSVDFVALDLETTGLDYRRHEIISVGFVHLTGLRIDLSSAQRRLVLPTGVIPEDSAVIHHITDDRAATGEALEAVLSDLLPILAGRVLIAHHARVELTFLNAACERIFGGGFLIPTVDTQWIEQRRRERRNQTYSPKELRLAELRKRYNLPRYRAHDALSDALGAAELFTAQLAANSSGRPVPLKEMLLRV